MSHVVGERVGAILSAGGLILRFLGYGVYCGREIPEEACGWTAETLREIKATNPKILLDSGKVVYGCECWWGSEEAVKAELEEFRKHGYKIEIVDIDDARVDAAVELATRE